MGTDAETRWEPNERNAKEKSVKWENLSIESDQKWSLVHMSSRFSNDNHMKVRLWWLSTKEEHRTPTRTGPGSTKVSADKSVMIRVCATDYLFFKLIDCKKCCNGTEKRSFVKRRQTNRKWGGWADENAKDLCLDVKHETTRTHICLSNRQEKCFTWTCDVDEDEKWPKSNRMMTFDELQCKSQWCAAIDCWAAPAPLCACGDFFSFNIKKKKITKKTLRSKSN